MRLRPTFRVVFAGVLLGLAPGCSFFFTPPGGPPDAGDGDGDGDGDPETDAGTEEQPDGGAIDGGSSTDGGDGDGDGDPDAGLDAGVPLADGGVDAGPAPWADTDFDYRVRVSINTSAIPGQLVQQFPLPVRVNANEPAFEHVSSGLAFYDDDGTMLPHEVATSGNLEMVAWVLAEVDGTQPGAGLWMYLDGPPAPGSADSVWDGFAAVWHLDQPNVNGAYDDARGDVLASAVPQGLDGSETVPGTVGNALAFDGTAKSLMVGHSATFDPQDGQVLTYSAWVKTTSTNPMSIMHKEAACAGASLVLFANPGQAWAVVHGQTTAGSCTGAAFIHAYDDAPPIDGQWHLVSGIFDRATANAVMLAIDGAVVAQSPMESLAMLFTSAVTPLYVGSRYDGAGQYFDGEIDEVRIGRGAPPPGWLPLRVATERDGAVSLGPLEGRP